MGDSTGVVNYYACIIRSERVGPLSHRISFVVCEALLGVSSFDELSFTLFSCSGDELNSNYFFTLESSEISFKMSLMAMRGGVGVGSGMGSGDGSATLVACFLSVILGFRNLFSYFV